MNSRPNTVERAFELASSGECHQISDILTRLKREGYGDARRHLDGAGLQRQLRELIAKSERES